jgi:hypothetical protein
VEFIRAYHTLAARWGALEPVIYMDLAPSLLWLCLLQIPKEEAPAFQRIFLKLHSGFPR